MLKRLSFTLTVTASLFGLYWLYALAVTPRLAPKILTAQQQRKHEHEELKFERPPSNVQNAEQFLPDASWATTAKFQIAMANGTLFTNTWRPVEDKPSSDAPKNLYEFRPFAMIWFDTPETGDEALRTNSNKQPMTLRSESGLVQFSSGFDPVNHKSGQACRVIGGKLEGKVLASGPDGLIVRGRDFFFHEGDFPELYSDAPVAFRYQQHRGTADSGFKADLIPSAEPSRPDQFLAVSGFKRVILRGHVEMDLANQDNPLRVTCDELFQFNLEQQVAWFQGNVNVERSVPNNEPDQLTGEYFELFLVSDVAQNGTDPSRSRDDAPSIVPILPSQNPRGLSVAGPNQGALDSPNEHRLSPASHGQFQMKEARMTGPWVEFKSPSNGLTALMTSLVYDVVTRTVKLAVVPLPGKPKQRELTTVVVRQKSSGTELISPRIRLTHDESGQIVSADGEGPGRMRRRDPGSNVTDMSAKWQQEFDLRRVPDSDTDLLTLVGEAVLQQASRKTGIQGEQIQLWFDRPTSGTNASSLPTVLRDNRNSVTLTANETTPRSVPDLTARGFRPRQLLAQDHVIVASPQMNAETDRFFVTFEETPPTPKNLVTPKKPQPRVRQAAGGKDDLAAKPKPSKREPPKVPAEPLQFRADQIRATVRLAEDARNVSNGDDSQAEVTEVWTEGKVDLQQPRDGETEPLRLLGDRLHLQNASRDGEQVLHVFGQPAMIRARGFDLEGNEVCLDRANNRAWVDGAGELNMPVKNDPFDGQALDSPTMLTVKWKEKMLFDGQTATFLDDVKAELKNSRLTCEEMEVVLTERFSFRDDAGPAPAAEVQRVNCKDGVQVDQKQFVNGDQSETRHGEFAALTLDQTSGRMKGIGPGKIDLWRPGRGKRAALAPRAVAQANRPLESDVANWEFTRVTFQGETVGNLHNRQTKFQDRVHITYGPVAHPLDTIDPDHLPKDGGDMECDSLQILQVNPAGTQKPHIELKAEGNAKLEGRTFNARADQITFDESKELYTLRAIGNRQVTIWRQTTAAGEPNELNAKSLWFIPSQNSIGSNLTTGIRGGTN